MRFVPVLALILFAACGDATKPAIVPQLSIVAGNAQIDTVGKTLPTQIAAMLRDRDSGAPLAGRIVNWVVVDGGGAVFAPVVQTGADGMARQTWTLGMTPGGQTLVARWLNPDTGEPVTFDTARATAVPNWTLTVSVVNQTDVPLVFTWQDGPAAGGRDSIPARGSRCERVLVRADSAKVRAEVTATSGGGFAWQESGWFSPVTFPAWSATATQGSNLLVVLRDDAAAC